jgi:hypothetical protein
LEVYIPPANERDQPQRDNNPHATFRAFILEAGMANAYKKALGLDVENFLYVFFSIFRK